MPYLRPVLCCPRDGPRRPRRPRPDLRRLRNRPPDGQRNEQPMNLKHLFSPGRIGSLELKNRVVKSPQTTATSNQDGTVTQRTVNHYRRLGEGGVGLVMME